MLNREADWAGLVIGHRGDPEGGIARASRKIRQHPYWRTLTDPATVARTARELAALGRQDPDDGPPVQPFRPVHLEQDRTFTVGPKDPAVRRDLARELDQAGLWDELTEAERRAEREFVAQTGCCLRFGLVHMDRRFFADGEGMAERGALRELDEIAPALAAAGVALDVVVVSDPFRPPPPGGEDYVPAVTRPGSAARRRRTGR
ncbi:MAG TPA: hypothetical protein VGX23_07235 [Actinocrinis sp.]|nr:hypothetical protein [Actinocrinis sp.]